MAHFVIVGGGVAAGKAAETLRKDGYTGDVTIVAAEPHPPYQRPPLSKGYLAGKEGLDAAVLHPASWYTDQQKCRSGHQPVARPDVDRLHQRSGAAVVSHVGPDPDGRDQRRADVTDDDYR